MRMHFSFCIHFLAMSCSCTIRDFLLFAINRKFTIILSRRLQVWFGIETTPMQGRGRGWQHMQYRAASRIMSKGKVLTGKALYNEYSRVHPLYYVPIDKLFAASSVTCVAASLSHTHAQYWVQWSRQTLARH